MNVFKKAIKEAEELNKNIGEVYDNNYEAPEEEWIWVEGYKGTDKDMCCRDFQYELGKQYDMSDDQTVEVCKSGFHLCLKLDDVFDYYKIGCGYRFFKVKALVRKTDKDNYCSHSLYWGSYNNKLTSKSIIFLSELTADEILKGTGAEELPEEYKQLAIEVDVDYAAQIYRQHILIKDGYSEPFALCVINNGKFDIAHAVGSQKDLSMDMKVWTIFKE